MILQLINTIGAVRSTIAVADHLHPDNLVTAIVSGISIGMACAAFSCISGPIGIGLIAHDGARKLIAWQTSRKQLELLPLQAQILSQETISCGS